MTTPDDLRPFAFVLAVPDLDGNTALHADDVHALHAEWARRGALVLPS